MPAAQKEKRRFYRHPIQVPIRLDVSRDSRPGQANSVDLSLGGISFLWPRKLNKGSSIEIGIPVKFTPVVDYAATVEALAGNKLALVWYGGLTSVQAARQAKGARRVIMRKEDAEFKSHFITRKETGIKELKELKGKIDPAKILKETPRHIQRSMSLSEKTFGEFLKLFGIQKKFKRLSYR